VYGVAGFERQFAVKRFHPEVVANANTAARLSAAARAYGGLEHPRIARLFEYGVAGGETFTACELVPGLDLAQLLGAANQPLPPGAAFALIASAARAVGYAHGRGILHLGLAPTNLIATPDGDVKVTDVGILAPRLPSRPSDDPQLLWRLAYLAPEQLIGESTSAATDVFAFGVIAFELVTGQRAFLGATALDIEQAILSAQPREPSLPKPLLRVLQRCWARSPFERFPDARALADAVDAALRLAPVPGGKREVAALVRDALDRIEHVREQQLSGAMNLSIPGVPLAPAPTRVTNPTGAAVSAAPVVRRPPSAPPVAVVPPRVVVPPAVVPAPPLPRSMPRGSKPSRPSGLVDDSTGEVTIARSPLDQALSTLGHDGEPTTPAPVALAAVVSRAPGERSPVPARSQHESGPTVVRDTPELQAQSAVSDDDDKSTTKMPPIELSRALTFSEALEPEIEIQRPLSDGDLSSPEIQRVEVSEVVELDSAELHAVSGDYPLVANGSPPPIVPLRPPTVTPPPTPEPPILPRKTPSALGQVDPQESVRPERSAEGAKSNGGRGSKRAFWAVVGVVLAGGAAAAAVLAYKQWGANATTTSTTKQPVVAAKTIDAGADAGVTKQPIATAATIDAGAAVTPTPGTGSGTGSAEKAVVADAMAVSSDPPGATVFLDGAEQGSTPITLPTARDKHTVAVVKAGYALYLKDVDGPLTITAKLEAITPTGGPAGIKVKCKTKDRYYVFVDGAPTGQLCPTERLNVALGSHTVEVYDLVSESRTQYPVVVKDTEHSLRVKVD
jgi:serine/threonine-protein kinase